MGKKSKITQLLIISVILIIIPCCKKNEAYLYYNEDYYNIFHERYEIYNMIKKSLYRHFFNVNEIKTDSFSSIESEVDKIIKNKTDSLIFMEDFTSPSLLKSDNIHKKSLIKLLTYNAYNDEEIPQNNSLALFDVQINAEIVNKKIIELFKRHSNKDDFSDCGIVINPDYSLSKESVNKLKENKENNIDVLELYGNDENAIKNWLTKKKRKMIILFSYSSNDFILKLKEKEFNDIIFVELITNYGEITDKIKYKIDIDWRSAFKYALNSNLFRNFIKLSSNDIKNKKNNDSYFIYKANYDNIVSIKRYNQMITK